jgi:hypothetical protein
MTLTFCAVYCGVMGPHAQGANNVHQWALEVPVPLGAVHFTRDLTSAFLHGGAQNDAVFDLVLLHIQPCNERCFIIW